MNILLVGVGQWGVKHLRVLRSLPVELYVVDLDGEKLQYCKDLGIPSSHLSIDLSAFISKIEAAVVVTPADTHAGICEELLKSRKDVFVEKPITLSSMEAKSLLDLARKNDCLLQVGHIFRYDAASQWLLRAMKEGVFGHINVLSGNFSGIKAPRKDTGVAFSHAIHFVDLFNYFMGGLPVRVNAELKDLMGRGMEDELLLTMDYLSGGAMTWAKLQAGYHSPGKCREIKIIGTKRSAVCDFNSSPREIKFYENEYMKEGNSFNVLEGEAQLIRIQADEPLWIELKAFLDSVQTRLPPLANGLDGYESVRVLEAVFESSRLGKSIGLDD